MTGAGGDGAIVLVVTLFIHPGREAEFRRFETEAARIMRRHGGRIDRVIRPTGPASERLVAARDPPRLLRERRRLRGLPGRSRAPGAGPLRESAISRTEVTTGVEGEPYGDGSP